MDPVLAATAYAPDVHRQNAARSRCHQHGGNLSGAVRVEWLVWQTLMISLRLWNAPAGPAVLLPPPVVMSCSFGGRPFRRVFKQHHAQLARCYTRVIEYQGGPEGTAVLHVTIAADGTVVEASVDGELGDTRITDCLATEAKHWKFAPDDTTVVVNYSLSFRIAR